MRLKSIAMVGAASVALILAFTTTGDAQKADLTEFRKVWNNKKSSNREKLEAVQNMPRNGAGLSDEYRMIFETDVWQWRGEVLQRTIAEADTAMIDAHIEWLTGKNADKNVTKQPAAAEHLLLGLMNNQRTSTNENFTKFAELVLMKGVPDKVRYRVLAEFGRFRSQPLGKHTVGLLVNILGKHVLERKADPVLRFLMVDALESLTSEEFGESHDKWKFWYDQLGDKELKPRKAEKFKDQYGDIEIEGHSFVRAKKRPVESVDVLILPEFGYSEKYWYPYIFELNKIFNCVFVDLPDASRVQGLKRPTDRAGNADPNAYYYPLAQLVEAFEKRREASGQKKIGIIAHGVSGWIAMEYVRLKPESVLFAVIMNTWSGNNSYGKARNQCEGSKDDDFKYYGAGLLYDPTGRVGYNSLTDDQKFHYQTGSGKRMHADRKAIEPIFYSADQSYSKRVGGGQALTPDYEFEREAGRTKNTVPTLFIWGQHDPMFVKDDPKLFQRVFTKGVVEIFPNSARVPWAEEPLLFVSKVKDLLQSNGIKTEIEEESDGKDKK